MDSRQIQRSIIIVASISLCALGGLLTWHFLRPFQPITKPNLVPTHHISASNSVGGTTQQPSVAPETPPEQRTQAPVVGPARAAEPVPASTLPTITSDPAPRQTEIASTINQQFTYHAYGTAPNDPYYGSSWAMTQTQAAGAWNYSNGTAITVAVIDTGFALQHEDLRNQWATNPGESGTTLLHYDSGAGHCITGTVIVNKSSNGCDDDNNGYTDDWRGWNFVATNNNPQAGQTSTNGSVAISHGTAVSGLIAAQTNNGVGVASYNWNAKVMPLQVLDDSGSGLSTSVIPAIHYAVDNGAKIINMSLGGPSNDPALADAILYAYSHDVVVVAAAGNCGTGTELGCDPTQPGAMGYPALYAHVISVGATDSTGTRAAFSSYGPQLDVVAPGSGAITSPLVNTSVQPYDYTSAYSASLYGTSFAAPIVSGVVALIESYRTTSSVDDITALVDGTAQKANGMNGATYTDQYGHGVISAQTAMLVSNSLNTNSPTTPVLLQTGDSRSEHTVSAAASMSSGCNVSNSTYCTVHLQDTMTGADRYLPYSKADTSGKAGWQWSGAIIQHGDWIMRAVQGTKASTVPYELFSK